MDRNLGPTASRLLEQCYLEKNEEVETKCCGMFAGDLNDMYSFDPSTNSWEEVKYSGTPPSPRHGHGFVTAHDGALYVFGGMNSAGK